MKLLFVTTNPGKVKSAQRNFEGSGIEVTWQNLVLHEPRGEDPVEIAMAKVHQAYDLLKKPLMVVDAGFSMDALNGWPGTFINFNLQKLGLPGFLKLLEGKDTRKACFFHVLAFHDGEKIHTFRDEVGGRISDTPGGKREAWHWSDLALIFQPFSENRTLAEMTESEFHDNYSQKVSNVYQMLCEHLLKNPSKPGS